MDRMLYLAMSGAKQTMLAQAAVTHNLANASTPGFRADLSQFRSMPVFGPGAPSRVYAMAERPGVDFTPGTIHSTGNPLDIAVNGDGWIAVQAPDGGEAYTRRGDLRISAEGIVTTGAGQPVLGDGGPIAVPPAARVEIGADGTISIQPIGQAPDTLAVLDRIKLVNPDPATLVKGADGLVRAKSGGPAAPDASVRVVSGSLEDSNVSTVSALVDLIGLSRSYEMQVRMMRTAEEDEAAATDMMKLA